MYSLIMADGDGAPEQQMVTETDTRPKEGTGPDLRGKDLVPHDMRQPMARSPQQIGRRNFVKNIGKAIGAIFVGGVVGAGAVAAVKRGDENRENRLAEENRKIREAEEAKDQQIVAQTDTQPNNIPIESQPTTQPQTTEPVK